MSSIDVQQRRRLRHEGRWDTHKRTCVGYRRGSSLPYCCQKSLCSATQQFWPLPVLLRLRVEPSRNRPIKKASKLLTFSTSGRNGSSPLLSEKERAEGAFWGRKRLPAGESVHSFSKCQNAQDCATDARRSAEAPSVESASKRRERVPTWEQWWRKRTQKQKVSTSGRGVRTLWMSA